MLNRSRSRPEGIIIPGTTLLAIQVDKEERHLTPLQKEPNKTATQKDTVAREMPPSLLKTKGVVARKV